MGLLGKVLIGAIGVKAYKAGKEAYRNLEEKHIMDKIEERREDNPPEQCKSADRKFTFEGKKCEKAAKDYDRQVKDYDYDDEELRSQAFESAKLYGARVVGKKLASFCKGYVIGSDALIVAEYLDEKWKEAEGASFRGGVRGRLSNAVIDSYKYLEEEYDVEIERV